jgi:hypothetical protein
MTVKLGIAATAFVLTLLYQFNPVETAYSPKCIFHVMTGLNCPGCGMQRFLHAFMHGNFLEAIQYNYILIFLIPYLLFFGTERFLLSGERQERWKTIIEGRAMTIILMIIAPSWFIIRNVLHI